MQTLILETHQLHNKIKSMSMEEKMLEIAGKAYELTYSCFSVQRITIKMDCQPTTSTALPKSGISFF